MTKLLGLPLQLTKNIALLLAALLTFFGAISWIAAREAIQVMAPIVSYTFGGCAILTAGLATVVFCLERTAWGRSKLAEHHRDRTLATNEAKQSNIETDRAALDFERARMHLKAETRLMSATVRQVERGLIHPAALGSEAKFSSFPAAVVKHIENSVPLLEAETRRDLLPALANCPNILIVGGKGRGKTSLLQWLEYNRLRAGNVVTILDSHATPGQWAGQTIGAGRQYESIAAAMLDLNAMLQKRYRQRTKGNAKFATVDTFIDEFTLLPDNLKALGFDIQTYSKPHLTEGRKVGMNCVWGIHSDRAAALGLKGAMDLLECFDAIVYLKKVQTDFYALVDFGEGTGEIKYNHPGPFAIDRPTSPVKILSLPAPATPPPDPEVIAVANWPKVAPAAPVAKYHPDNVNAAIDELLAADPETFPTKGQVTEAVGITGGSKYKAVVAVYEQRFNEWQNA